MAIRVALFGGPVFFVLWFLGAQIQYFASGGGPNGDPAPSAEAYPSAVLSNPSGINGGAVLLVLAAVSLIWFSLGLRARTESQHRFDLFPLLSMGGVAFLLIVQAGLSVASLQLAEQAPDTAWHLRELSMTLGFESFITPLLGGAALTALVLNDRDSLSKRFWWFTVVTAAVLGLFGLLEGLTITPPGRFSILFGLWAFAAGFALQAGLDTDPKPARSTSI